MLTNTQRKTLREIAHDMGDKWRLVEKNCLRNGNVVLRPEWWESETAVTKWRCWPENRYDSVTGRTVRAALRNAARFLRRRADDATGQADFIDGLTGGDSNIHAVYERRFLP